MWFKLPLVVSIHCFANGSDIERNTNGRRSSGGVFLSVKYSSNCLIKWTATCFELSENLGSDSSLNWLVSTDVSGCSLTFSGQSGWNRIQPDSPRQRPHNLHETYQLPRVQLITPDEGHRRCPKHVQFCDKVKFWILDASCWLFIRRLSRCTVTWT
jgi:hypothetical protein